MNKSGRVKGSKNPTFEEQYLSRKREIERVLKLAKKKDRKYAARIKFYNEH